MIFQNRIAGFIVLSALVCNTVLGDESIRAAVDDEGRVVSFQRDIAPILSQRCLECHGPEDAKNDFRVDDVDSVMQYVEAGDLESSSMFVDYLITDDEDMLMPPTSHGGPLSPTELAVIRVWISEGADWPEEASVSTDKPVEIAPLEAVAAPKGILERLWAFQGFLHPATVHFPVALLLVGALFVVLGLKWPELGNQIPVACLILGSLSAVSAAMMGWSFATQEGYGGWNKIDFDSEIFWHRWSGIFVAVLSTGLTIVAAFAWWRDSVALGKVWRIGLVVAAGIVGLVGHQGGELTYGKEFYPKAFAILLGSDPKSNEPANVVPTPKNAAAEATGFDVNPDTEEATRSKSHPEASDIE